MTACTSVGRSRNWIGTDWRRGSAGAEPLVSSESLDVRWWPIDALPADSGADLRPLIAAGLAVLDRCGSECGQRDQRHREGAGDLADADLSRG